MRKKISTTPIKAWFLIFLALAVLVQFIPEVKFLGIIVWVGSIVTSIRKFNQLGLNYFGWTLVSIFLTGLALIIAWIKVANHNKIREQQRMTRRTKSQEPRAKTKTDLRPKTQDLR